MNYSDSERIAGLLEKNGLKSASKISEADLVVFNTCGVRQMAEDRVYGQIHNIHKTWGMKHRTKKIVMTGCLANRKDVQRRLKNKVDLFFPISNFDIFENWIIKNSFKIPAQKNITEKESIAYLSTNPKHTSKYQAYVPIMTGCNNFCAYCVVPYARGQEVSRPVEEIIKEVKSLIKRGYKEIILLGQNVNSYQNKKTNFPQLLKKINFIPGNFWISFISNHPKDFSDELIETATKLKKVCEFIHLPIQSGDSKILEKMNRKYTAAHYLSLVKKIKIGFKKNKPNKVYSITSDIIVGFPGETKKQFLESAEIMKKVGYDMVFFGQYSPRPGTVAWKMKDSVSKKEKVIREQCLNEILKKSALKNNRTYVGKTLEVLVDKDPVKFAKANNGARKNGFYFGRTRTMKNVKIVSARENLVGKIIKAKITKANIWNLEGATIK